MSGRRLIDSVDRGFWDGTTALVTGASGFIGSWLAEVLLASGAHVIGTVERKSLLGSFYAARRLPDRMDTVEIDIRRLPDMRDLLNTMNPGVVFHLAALALVPVCKRDPRGAFETNLMGTLNLLEACRQLKSVDRVLLSSTDHVFGNPPDMDERTTFDEDSPLRGSGPYDTSKAAMEMAIQSFLDVARDDLPAVGITRCANVFGPGDINQRRIIPDFVKAARTQERFGPWYPHNRRQYIFAIDTVVGYIRAAERLDRGRSGEIFHYAIESYDSAKGAMPSISCIELAERIAAIAGRRGRDVAVDESFKKADFAPNENKYQALDCTRTRERLGWQPQFTIEEGLEATYDWYDAFSRGTDDAREYLDGLLASNGIRTGSG